ncbi:MAG TPA: HXXEE domain-containing protein [Anaerolineales bacterium]|nr:HXXEE domain-containing protein [Anaerolineales bacterium]
MKTETIMWLLPIVFMIHDFEEIIMFRAWLTTDGDKVRQRFPRRGVQFLRPLESLSTAAMAMGIAVVFLVLSVSTILAVELSFYNFWAGLLLGFFIHLIAHIGQYILMKRYVPCVITSVLGSVYCIWALGQMSSLLNWPAVGGWTAFAGALIVVVLSIAHKVGALFEHFLQSHRLSE